MRWHRRSEDLRPRLIQAAMDGESPLDRSAEAAGEQMLLLELPDGGAVLVTGAEVQRIPAELSGGARERYAAGQAAAWRRERDRMSRRLRLADEMLQYCEALQAARSPSEVHLALSLYASRIVGGHRAVVYLRERRAAAIASRTRPDDEQPSPPRLYTATDRLLPMGLLTSSDVGRLPAEPYSELSPLFVEDGAASLAYACIAGEAVLFLVERRRERVFNSEDWDLLCSLVRQAESALERLGQLAEATALALTDPLTGTANRRHLEIVLEHCFASARRGTELALVMIDLDDFKRINDLHGHAAGDRLLRRVGEALRAEARESDLAARTGGDEFVLLLPGCSAAGARLVVDRVRLRLGPGTAFSTGMATVDPGTASPASLLAAADTDLYVQKRERQQQALRFGTRVSLA